MKAIIEDPQPEAELQELYILSRHWISDISFVEGEIRFLRNMFHKYLTPAPGIDLLVNAADLEIALAAIDTDIPNLKCRVFELLKFLDPLINEAGKVIGMDLFERFFPVALEVKSLLESVAAAKKLVFAFVESVLNAEPHDRLSIT